MPFSEAQITHAIEQGLCRTSTLGTPRVVRITCEDVVWYGLSANTFARCGASIIADSKEQLVKLVIKRWAPGGPTDIDMGIDPLPRESLAFAAGIFGPDSMPPRIDAPFVATLDAPESNDHWVVLRDVSVELTAFRSPSDLSEIHQRYSVALDQLALIHATWEKPDLQARLKLDPELGGIEFLKRLFLRFHDVGERGIARLIQAKVRRHDSRHLQIDRLQATVDLAGDFEMSIRRRNL